MNRDNPSRAVDSLVGRAYELRGVKVYNTNLVMFALEKSGFGLVEMNDMKFVAALPIVAYAMTHPVSEVVGHLSSKQGVCVPALEYCADFSPEEMAEVAEIFKDCLVRFRKSIPVTGGSGGNGEAAAATS
ncbi:MAG: hypothetical protein J6L64_07800 [Opitutales bacterium]|nr:hypothetical protein [Opitutales bacterium]